MRATRFVGAGLVLLASCKNPEEQSYRDLATRANGPLDALAKLSKDIVPDDKKLPSTSEGSSFDMKFLELLELSADNCPLS